MSSIPGQSGFMRTILLLACVLPHICSVTSESDKETCYSQQHRGVTVNIRLALTKGTIMIPRETPSEKDCILTCCSEDVNPGVKCNRVVYKPSEGSSSENCYLFYCPNEQDCPLMTAEPGVNTYNIFKGVTHPTTKVNGKAAAKPATNLNPQLNTTMPTTIPPPTTSTTITTTTTTTVTTLVTTTTKPTITKLPITTRPITTTTTTTTDIPSTKALETPTEGPTELLETTSMTSATIAKTTTTTQSTTTTTTTQPTTTTQTTSTTTKARPPARPAAKPSRPRKPSKPLRGPETHSVKPTKAKTATPHPITSTAPSTTAPTTSTTTTTTTTAAPQTSTGTTVALVEFDSKERGVNQHPLLPPVLGSAPVKPRFSRTMWKNSLVAVVVITLIFLLLILALVARKAMESFDRRHYTRLELNDLHYEV